MEFMLNMWLRVWPKRGSGHTRKSRHGIRKQKLSVPPADHREGKGGWSSITSYQYFNLNVPTYRNPSWNWIRLRKLQGWWTHSGAERLVCPEVKWKLCVPSSYFALCIASIWLSLNYILDNETVILNIMLSCVLSVTCSSKSSRARGIIEIPKFIVCQPEVKVTWGYLIFVASIWNGAILWDWLINLWGQH